MSNATLRTLKLLIALKGRSLTGISNTELSAQTGETIYNVTRAMNDLISAGLAIRTPNGRFAPSVALLGIAVAHFEECDRAQSRINEHKQRVAVAARQ